MGSFNKSVENTNSILVSLLVPWAACFRWDGKREIDSKSKVLLFEITFYKGSSCSQGPHLKRRGHMLWAIQHSKVFSCESFSSANTKKKDFKLFFSFSYQTMISQLIKSYSAGAVRRNLVETETKPHQTQWSLIGDNHHHLHQVIMPKIRPNCETSVHSLPFPRNLIFWWLERCLIVIEYHYREPLRHCWCLMTFTFLDLMHYQG